MAKVPVSCFIIAKNEADRIARTIKSVRPFVDEVVVVVDSGSADETFAVARAEGCRVIVQHWLGFGGQKRFAEDRCRNDWVLNLDADEVATPELMQEIEALFERGDPSLAAFSFPILMVYPGAERPRRWAKDHIYVRLYNKRSVRFRDSPVHDSVVTDGHEVGALKSKSYHYSMRSFRDMSRKLDERMWLLVRHSPCRVHGIIYLRLITELPMNFFKYYITRRHFMGGVSGFWYSAILARYRAAKIYRIWRNGSAVPRDASQETTTDISFVNAA